jgi:branched-chain amino acid transport system substrate-binding protein
MTGQFIAEGFKRAGKVDKEALINTIEGLSLDSPMGPLAIRACDHLLERPVYFGVTKKSPKYEFLIADDIHVVPAKEAMLTCDEVYELRKK